MAFDHALASESFSGTSDRGTMDCPWVTQEDDATSSCSMSTPGSIPRVWSRVATVEPIQNHFFSLTSIGSGSRWFTRIICPICAPEVSRVRAG